jgi:hypothetical protein
MEKGMICSVYESKDHGNCSNDGVSARYSSVVLIGPGIPELFEPKDDRPAVYLDRNFNGVAGNVAAVAKGGDGVGPMFGGSFIYTSDSRFPGGGPLKLMDRYESAELNDLMSR